MDRQTDRAEAFLYSSESGIAYVIKQIIKQIANNKIHDVVSLYYMKMKLLK